MWYSFTERVVDHSGKPCQEANIFKQEKEERNWGKDYPCFTPCSL